MRRYGTRKHIYFIATWGGELENLKHFLLDLNIIDDAILQQLDPESIKATIAEFLIRCPVYRYYGNTMPLEQEEAEAVRSIFTSLLYHTLTAVM